MTTQTTPLLRDLFWWIKLHAILFGFFVFALLVAAAAHAQGMELPPACDPWWQTSDGIATAEQAEKEVELIYCKDGHVVDPATAVLCPLDAGWKSVKQYTDEETPKCPEQ